MPRRVIPLLVVAAAAACFAPRAAATDDWPAYVPVTSSERRQLQPLARVAVSALRSGRLAVLCDLHSPREVRRAYGNLAQCRAALARATHPCAGRCTYVVATVLGVYETRRDRTLGRKTVGWLFRVQGHPQYRGESELELKFRREAGRWVLGTDVVESGSARR